MASKQHITISVDYGVSDKVKKQGLNISEVCNNALHAVLVEERVKEQQDIQEVDNFKQECGYLPVYDTFTEEGYLYFKNSKLVLKTNVEKIKQQNPTWDNAQGLMRYLAKKYDTTV